MISDWSVINHHHSESISYYYFYFFRYVFGTFTNCFTFKGDNSWTKSKKFASRMLIGQYLFAIWRVCSLSLDFWVLIESAHNAIFLYFCLGWYWVFSIIVTACYTGSIIAFITLYVYPPVIDTVDQLLAGNFRVGSLSKWLTPILIHLPYARGCQFHFL